MQKIINLALVEDIGTGDITAKLIDPQKTAKAKIISRCHAVICGKQWVDEIFKAVDSAVTISWKIKDGDTVNNDQCLCLIEGPARALLTAERTALNFLQILSSTATLTRQFAEKIQHTNTKLLDTRKTLPGLRAAQKYAVVCGGGKNHRQGLYDAILIKENHIAFHSNSLTAIVNAAKTKYPDKLIEIEVKNLQELTEVLSLPINIAMLDNFSLEDIKQAVTITKGKIKLEASGEVTLQNIKAIAETGVDYISVGALTKTVIPIELSMLFI